MIPDDLEKIIMTKEDYDRNVEQLLLDKCKAELEVERLNNIIKELEKKLLEWHEYWEYDDEYNWQYKDTYDYLQELKGSNEE